MNRQELKQRINDLPLFEKRELKVKDENGEFVEIEKQKAICKTTGDEPYAFVGDRYNIVQFANVFNPILDNVEGDVEGYVMTHRGFAALTLFPNLETLKEGNSRFGIVAMNSVDCSSAVIVKFCIEQNNRRISVPPKVAGVKKAHTNQAVNLVEDYMKMIGPVKDFWAKIVREFPKYQLVMSDAEAEKVEGHALMLGDTMENLNIGTRLSKKIVTKYETLTADGHTYTLWDLFTDALDTIDEKEYKSEVHKQQKLDRLTQSIFEYCAVMSI